ncbi:MAG: type transporter [Candidatus Berkelbacteria bacterium]|nr:type transporter [Candidatus Berkelbacteria bacterium]
MPKIFEVFYKNKSLIWRMAYKDVTDRYAGSALGLFWALFYPLFLVGIYAVIFTFIFQIRINQGSSPLEYSLYAIVGLVAWIVMQEGLTKSTSSITSNTSLVKQVIFPVNILPIVGILVSFLTLIIGIAFYIIVVGLALPHNLSWTFFLVPVVVLIHFLFSVGLGWILASLAVYFRDLKELIMMILLVGMFITPVLYLENSIPQAFKLPIFLNPMTHLINMYRDVLFYGQINHPWSFVIFGGLSITIFVLGFYFFEKLKPFFSNVL